MVIELYLVPHQTLSLKLVDVLSDVEVELPVILS
jgi:hypothetical protein